MNDKPMAEGELPALPQATIEGYDLEVYGQNVRVDLFTAAQMRAYGRACAAPAPVARLTLPEGWVPLTIEWEPGYPEDVAYGPQRMMGRLKKWLDKHFAARIAAVTKEGGAA